MKVFLTGGTGFVGAHSALELLRHGHEVRFLVRNPAALKEYFRQHGFEVDDFVQADMRNREAIKAGLEGCDALLHCAAVVGIDPKRAQEIREVNLDSVDAVVGTAWRCGIKNILYVSSLGALFQPGKAFIDETSGVGSAVDPYAKSKVDCEHLVRTMQEDGAPIMISYPSGVFGPDDPKLSESNHALVSFLSDTLVDTTSGLQFVDVRDVAIAHRMMLERATQRGLSHPSNERYIIGGHFLPWREITDMLQRLTGRQLRCLKAPAPLLRFAGRVLDTIRKIKPINFPMTTESMVIVTRWSEGKSTRFINNFTFQFRSGEETFGETIRWLVAEGHLDKKYAGKLAP